MKIELEEPFRSLWKTGYLVINKEPRRTVLLVNDSKDRTSISYARYLYCVSIGRILEQEYVVDHINGDKLDDRLDNFQLLSVKDNNIKGYVERNKTKKMVEFKCGVCGTIFNKERRNTHLVIKTKNSDYCSRKCAGKSSKHEPSSILKEYRS